MKEHCAFCMEETIRGEYFFGKSKTHTMYQMLGKMFGMLGYSKEEEDNELKDGIKLVDGNLLFFDNSSREYDPIGIQIQYCPMCGKKLHGKGEEE